MREGDREEVKEGRDGCGETACSLCFLHHNNNNCKKIATKSRTAAEFTNLYARIVSEGGKIVCISMQKSTA